MIGNLLRGCLQPLHQLARSHVEHAVAGFELRLDAVALDAALGPFGHFVFQQASQEARR